ncbi:MAG: ATP-binding protein [Actinomycetota bacterium]|nr:ATP-binding protein [Actinomycetota bacterium]
MDRHSIKDLENWKASKWRKPLVILGARQVGKTWLIQEFGKRNYEKVVYLNCQSNSNLGPLFDGDLDPNRLLQGIQIIARETIDPTTTLVVIDEIQEVPRALTSLKYFQEQRPDIHLATAGSLLGVAIHKESSFPVGKVNIIDLHPMDFDEFLRGLGEEKLADLLVQQDFDLISTFQSRFIELLGQYLFVGGMPEAVVRYREGRSVEEVRQIQREIVRGYENDFAKYATPSISRQISQVWSSMPHQLARENRRFVFGHVREGARSKDFEDAIRWLQDAGLVHKVTRYTKPGHPARSYEDPKIFKLFLHDVGILGAISGLDPEVLVNRIRAFEEFHGALTEQYVLQQIVAATNEVPMYWTPEKPTAEVDFAIERPSGLVPIEVKASENLKSKSLRSYIDRFNPEEAVRFSLSDYRWQEDLVNIPLYAIGPWLRN